MAIEIRVHTSHVAVLQEGIVRDTSAGNAQRIDLRVYHKDSDTHTRCALRLSDDALREVPGDDEGEKSLRLSTALSGWLADHLPDEGSVLTVSVESDRSLMIGRPGAANPERRSTS